MKTCSRCKETKPLDKFGPDKRGIQGRHSWCRKCVNAYRQTPGQVARVQARLATPRGKHLQRDTKLRLNYGSSVSEWETLFLLQGGRCPGCDRVLARDRTTHMDHDHASNAVRGLLCESCNLALGHAKDNPETLEGLARYLRRVIVKSK